MSDSGEPAGRTNDYLVDDGGHFRQQQVESQEKQWRGKHTKDIFDLRIMQFYFQINL